MKSPEETLRIVGCIAVQRDIRGVYIVCVHIYIFVYTPTHHESPIQAGYLTFFWVTFEAVCFDSSSVA